MNTFKEFLIALKDLVLEYVKSRLFPVSVVMLVLFCLLVNKLFQIQIVEGEEHSDNFIYKSRKTLTVDSVRGNIYDADGNLLAYNKLSYNVTFANDANLGNMAEEMGMSENELKNKIVYDTIQILESHGDTVSTDFPISIAEDGSFAFTTSGTNLNNFIKDVYAKNSYDELSDEQKSSTAEDIFNYLRYGNSSTGSFNISSDYTDEEALKIMGCRYKLWLNRYQQYVPVDIAYDISRESSADIKENQDRLTGIDIDVRSLRVYNDAEYFAHIIGYIGYASAEDLEELNAEVEEGNEYTGTDMVGKMGIERIYESELRGTDGETEMYVDNLGKVLEVISETPAEAGNDVYLTIESDLQKYCYDTLEKEIASILLANITSAQYAPEDNSDDEIPITDVYFALFNNNLLSISKMNEDNAGELERSIYALYLNRQAETISRLDSILTVEFTPLSLLSNEYQSYMEYICEFLSAEGVFDTSKIENTDTMFVQYTSDQISLAEYLKYAISVEAIDISSIEADNTYYDSDEIYNLLCEYIINYLQNDTEFDKLLIKRMIQSSEITGSDVVNLLYEQGVLEAEGDEDYAAFSNREFGPYEFMRRKIEKLEITPAMLALAPCSGSVVVTDVNTGEVRALVSYPSYDNNYLTNTIDAAYYNRLINDKTNPLYNRACRQLTAPGSTFKIVSAIAGVSEGAIDLDTIIYDSGPFTKVYTQPKCWVYPGSHGAVGIQQAIKVSCNYFFYEVGYRLASLNGTYSDSLGVSLLQKYATMFGLGDNSGIELQESAPHISDNDAVTSAIGQATNAYTPTQLAKYVSTIANSGTAYNLSVVDRITDYEGDIIYTNQHTISSTVSIDSALWDTVHSGMRLVVTDYFRNNSLLNSLSVNVAGKTGTAQESRNKPAHALFISYAPYENPEVSVTVVIQNGYSSGNAVELASMIYAYMYNPELLEDAEVSGNTIVGD